MNVAFTNKFLKQVLKLKDKKLAIIYTKHNRINRSSNFAFRNQEFKKIKRS